MGFFFFSSRRRHTRFDCDWSSDVCSSDLNSITLTFDDALRGPFNGQKSLVFRPSREGDVWGNWSTDRMTVCMLEAGRALSKIMKAAHFDVTKHIENAYEKQDEAFASESIIH